MQSQEQVKDRVLLVDDCEDNLFLISCFLLKSGFEVDTANHASQGIEMAMKNSYAVILMDIQMPEIDGFSAVKTLRIAGCQIPIIAVTAGSAPSPRFSEAGFNLFLRKPIRRDELVGSILNTTSRPPSAQTLDARSLPPL